MYALTWKFDEFLRKFWSSSCWEICCSWETKKKRDMKRKKRKKNWDSNKKREKKARSSNLDESLLMSIFWVLERKRSIERFLLTRAFWRRSINDEFFQRQWILSFEFSDEEERDLSDAINYYVIIMNSKWMKKCMMI